ncbi:baculoviral IAP repeat-containing protein 3-like [Littorina saxatilis]|uniref:RING-type domain-containing protein n=1 Tax=Littorina saxatilis TaxID=31220 RepID=A0AAN9GHS2_9CAEN
MFPRTFNPPEVRVAPVTRFLPDATFNPDIDLAHLGYRLATLGALSGLFPVSRVKLADAGFYFRGQGDEMTCYSCRVRHSGWTREDNPMDVHRRLSPSCQHVREKDGEQSGGVGPRGSGDVAPTGTESRPLHSHAMVNRASPGMNTPVEDSETTPTQTASQTGERTSSLQASGSAASPNASHRTSAIISQSDSNSRPAESTARTAAAHSSSSSENRSSSRPLQNSTSNSTPQFSNNSSQVSNTTASPAANRTSSNSSATLATSSNDNTRDPPTRPVSTNTSTRQESSDANNSSREGERAEGRSLFPTAALDLGGAVYPMYQDMASRRRTFTQWNDSQAPPLDYVILCGMFYAGYADCVRCFYCGVGLKHWVPTDDVWTEHVRWRPGCGYLIAIKGEQFIRDTQRRLGIETSGGSQGAANSRDSVQTAGQRPPSTTQRSSTGTASSAAAAITTSATASVRSTSASSSSQASITSSNTGNTAATRTPATVSTTRQTSTASSFRSPSNQSQATTTRTTVTTSTSSARQTSTSSSSQAPRASANTSRTPTTSHHQPSTTSSSDASGESRASVSQPAVTSAEPASQGSRTPSSITSATSGNGERRGEGTSSSGTTSGASLSEGGSSVQSDGEGSHSNRRGTNVVAAASSAEERERLARLQAENRRLTQRFQCRVCRQAAIDTIIMPCGHLVVCESCAGTVTSCPLCHDAIRATARVHMA